MLAHLKRDFIQISERIGASAEIGKSLLEQEQELFNLWYQYRNDQLTRSELEQVVEPIQTKILSQLQEAAQLNIGENEKTPLAKTVRTCRNLLKLEPALWLFITENGVEPTNNAAERAIRPAVIWRRTSFGSDSVAGSFFVTAHRNCAAVSQMEPQIVMEKFARFVETGNFPSSKCRPPLKIATVTSPQLSSTEL